MRNCTVHSLDQAMLECWFSCSHDFQMKCIWFVDVRKYPLLQPSSLLWYCCSFRVSCSADLWVQWNQNNEAEHFLHSNLFPPDKHEYLWVYRHKQPHYSGVFFFILLFFSFFWLFFLVFVGVRFIFCRYEFFVFLFSCYFAVSSMNLTYWSSCAHNKWSTTETVTFTRECEWEKWLCEQLHRIDTESHFNYNRNVRL